MPEARVIEGLPALDRGAGRIFAVVGVFDGLHRGHAYLVRQLVRESRLRDSRPAVITFDHHPDEIIRGAAPPLLLDPAERIARMSSLGVEVVLVAHFDERLRRTTYIDFIDALRQRVDLAGILMTSESAFGHERRGTPDAVAALGRDRGFDVVVVEPLTIDGHSVSSSAIRASIAAGELRAAGQLLGRRVAVTGEIPASSPRTVTFALPVALPPVGRYEAIVGPPVDVGPAARRIERRRSVSVSPVGIDLASDAPSGARLRVAFPG